MNTQGNRRFSETEKRIRSALLVLLEKKELPRITVNELCTLAGVHRTTFYGHFEDVYDLMRRVVGEEYLEMIDFFLSEDPGQQGGGFTRLFRQVGEHSSLFRYYFAHYGYLGMQGGFLPEPLEKRLGELTARMGYTSEEELLYHQAFFSAGLTAMMSRWLEGGCRESPEEMSAMLEREYAPDRTLFGC